MEWTVSRSKPLPVQFQAVRETRKTQWLQRCGKASDKRDPWPVGDQSLYHVQRVVHVTRNASEMLFAISHHRLRLLCTRDEVSALWFRAALAATQIRSSG